MSAMASAATDEFLSHLASSPVTRDLAQSLGYVVDLRRMPRGDGADVIDLASYRARRG